MLEESGGNCAHEVEMTRAAGNKAAGNKAAGNKAAARRVEDEDRVVYRDLVDPDARSLLFSPDPPRRPVSAAEAAGSSVLSRPKGIFHPQQPLFHLDGSDGEGGADGESDDENPFASLLQAAPPRPASPPRVGDAYSPDDSIVEASMRLTEPTSTQERGDSQRWANAANLLALSTRERGAVRDRGVNAPKKTAATKRLSFEAADSRPARWGSRPSKPSAKDAQNRRKSLDAIRSRREVRAAGSTRRPASVALKGARSSLDDTQPSQGMLLLATKKPRLSEVLQRATLLSQHKADDSPAAHSHPLSPASPVEHDAILDTEQQLKAEPFSPPIFSPSRANEVHAGRKQRQSGNTLAKLRGDIGEAVRKAVRRTKRDLTLLRADGQSLLAQQGGGASSVVERIQERGHVIVCLRAAAASGQHTFECRVHSTSGDVEESCPSSSERVQVVLSQHTVEVVKAAPGVVLRIFAPFHFVPRHTPVGSTGGARRWFLIGTQLAEAVERDHACSQ